MAVGTAGSVAAAGCAVGSRRGRSTALMTAAVLAAVRTAAGAGYTWDANGPAAGTGGTGVWNTLASNPVWTVDGATYGPWPSSGTGNVATFGGTPGTVTVNGAVAAAGLTFAAAGYTIAGTSGLTLTGASPTFDTGGYNATFGLGANLLSLSGGTAIAKVGTGTLTLVNDQRTSLGNNVTWSVSGGTVDAASGLYNSGLALATAQPLGNPTGSVVNLDGATLAFTANGGAGYAGGRAINVSAKGGAIFDGGFAPGLGTTGGATIAPTITVAAGPGLNLVAGNVLDLDAATIAGGGPVNVRGPGQVRIRSTNNTYTGGTTVAAGSTLVIGGAKSLGQGGGNLTVAGTLNLNAAPLNVGRFTDNGGTVAFNLSSAGTLVNPLTAATAAVSGTNRIVLSMPTINTVAGGATYTVATSAGGGLGGNYAASFLVPGGQNLSVPVNAIFRTVNGTNYRLTATAAAAADGKSVAVTTADAPAPAHTLTVLPLGSSITAGTSAQSPYDGGGYRGQLYQNLANDGRFTPRFVGGQTGNQANNPAGPDLLSTVGQPNHEGHPGFTTSNILGNLNAGGNWLAPGNGVNPDYVTLNVGGNDYVANPNDTTAINRLGQIIDQVSALRPNATIVVSSILYRGDAGGVSGAGIVRNYNPYLPSLVYRHVLAGQHVSYLDLYGLITPGNSLALISPDLVHPTQAGYNRMANGWYSAITTGQAFYTGNAGPVLTASGGGQTSFAMDFQRTTDSGAVPSAGTDVYFNGVGGPVTLGGDLSVRGLNFTAGATTPVAVGGTDTLTIGAGGITVQAGSAAHQITAAVGLASAQTWANVSASPLAVTGTVAGVGPLTVGGSGTVVLSGRNTFAGGTAVTGGTVVAGSGTALGAGPVSVGAGATLSVAAAAGGGPTVLALAGLTLAGREGAYTAAVDVAGNGLDLPGASLATVTAAAAQGFAGGTFAGGGIVSSTAAADPAHLTAVGVIANAGDDGTPLYGDGTALPPFDGASVAVGDVLVRATYFGDANLDGVVDAADYTRIDAGFLTHLTGWFNGDFNYDGVVDASDYTLIDNAFNFQSAPALAASVAASVAAVPEPASGAAIIAWTAAAVSTLRPSRRRRS